LGRLDSGDSGEQTLEKNQKERDLQHGEPLRPSIRCLTIAKPKKQINRVRQVKSYLTRRRRLDKVDFFKFLSEEVD